jgi:hypothetical protein
MNWWKLRTKPAGRSSDTAARERRKQPRIGGHFNVRYSGQHEDEIIMGHATIVDLSRYGFGLKGAHGLKPGMELALVLEISDMDMSENLYIPHAHVAWVDGRYFGVEIPAAREKEPVWLEYLAGCN